MESTPADDNSSHSSDNNPKPEEIEPDDPSSIFTAEIRSSITDGTTPTAGESAEAKPLFEHVQPKPIKEGILRSKSQNKKKKKLKVRVMHNEEEKFPDDELTQRMMSIVTTKSVAELPQHNEFGFIRKDVNEETTKDIVMITGANIRVQDFQTKEKKELSKKEKEQLKKTLQVRIKKWQRMLESYPTKVHPKLKSRARKGIPDSFRATAWKTLACIEKVKSEFKDFDYNEKLNEQVSKKNADAILKDITRTFPNHVYFYEKFGKGQMKLFDVLKVLSMFVPE